jgi:hypothetical protein
MLDEGLCLRPDGKRPAQLNARCDDQYVAKDCEDSAHDPQFGPWLFFEARHKQIEQKHDNWYDN